MPRVSCRFCGETMQDFEQSGIPYFGLPQSYKMEPERLLYTTKDVVAYAI